MEFITNAVGGWLLAHPKALAAIVTYLVVVKMITAFVDALVSSRAEWDKTPLSDDTWYEKAVTIAGRGAKFLGKVAAYLSGFRPKPKAEVVLETNDLKVEETK